MENWRETWRRGFVPQLSTEALLALREALVNNDPKLIQGATTSPPPLQCVQDWPAEGACLIGYCGVIDHGGFGQATVAETEIFFSTACFQADQWLKEPAACRYLLNPFDDWSREEMIQNLLPEVELALRERSALCELAVC